MLRLFLASFGLLAPMAAHGQEPDCPSGRADQRFAVQYPVNLPRDTIATRADSLLPLLGYSRADGKPGSNRYKTAWRAGWPPATERAPWRTTGPGPGLRLDMRFDKQGDLKSQVSVAVEILCALQSRELSRSNRSTEYYAGLFAAVQVITALTNGIDAALRGF